MKMTLGRLAALAGFPVLLLALGAGLGAGSAAAQPASGNQPPPKGFEADSASFVSAQTGFVLGARGCSTLPCRALLEKTVNGGRTWAPVPAPAVSLVPTYSTSPASAVSTVRFENASDGWLLGPALWATTDGGAQWHRMSLPGEVIALAASDGVAFAVSEPVSGGLYQARLYESQVGTTRWTLVPGIAPQNALTVFGHSVWAGVASGVDGSLQTSADSGKHWSALSFRCPSGTISASAVAAASTARVAIGCSDQGYPQPGQSIKKVFTSANGGRTFHLAGSPPIAGQIRTLAMPPGRPRVITMSAASGATYLFRSANGGRTWGATVYLDGGLDTRDLAYVSPATGYVIHFSGGPVIAYSDGLLKTSDAGATWTAVPIP
jgi:photosystem II stability/assembly factor-like uncharacterized protein